jgi:polyisoprenyl-phosphate glycosyltransferase
MMTISIVIPVNNEEDSIPELYIRVSKALNNLTNQWEVLCINDGSDDKSLPLLVDLHKKDNKWKVIDLSKNFGHQRAIWAGLEHATGDFIGIMDADLQDAPELFETFLNNFREEIDVVYAIRKNRKENVFKKMSYWFFYRLLKYVFGIDMPLDSGDFCLMRKKVVEQILKMPEQSLFFRGIRSWVGFNQKGINYERDERQAGKSKYSLRRLFRLAYNGLYSFSNFPIKFLGRLGLFIIISSALYSIWIITKKLVWGTVPEGFTTLILVILFFGGIQLVTVRILGEYIYRIYDETRKRPLYIIRDMYGDIGNIKKEN